MISLNWFITTNHRTNNSSFFIIWCKITINSILSIIAHQHYTIRRVPSLNLTKSHLLIKQFCLHECSIISQVLACFLLFEIQKQVTKPTMASMHASKYKIVPDGKLLLKKKQKEIFEKSHFSKGYRQRVCCVGLNACRMCGMCGWGGKEAIYWLGLE